MERLFRGQEVREDESKVEVEVDLYEGCLCIFAQLAGCWANGESG